MRHLKNVSALVIATLVLFSAGSALAQLKIGYVDSQKILQNYKEHQDAQAELQKLYEAWQKEAADMERELQQKQEQLNAQALVLTEKTKAERATEIQNLYLRRQQFEQEKLGPQGEFYKEQGRLLQPIVDKIQGVIQKLGEDENYAYIFDISQPSVIFANKSQSDLTERILQELEKGASANKSAANGPANRN